MVRGMVMYFLPLVASVVMSSTKLLRYPPLSLRSSPLLNFFWMC